MVFKRTLRWCEPYPNREEAHAFLLPSMTAMCGWTGTVSLDASDKQKCEACSVELEAMEEWDADKTD